MQSPPWESPNREAFLHPRDHAPPGAPRGRRRDGARRTCTCVVVCDSRARSRSVGPSASGAPRARAAVSRAPPRATARRARVLGTRYDIDETDCGNRPLAGGGYSEVNDRGYELPQVS